MGEFVNRIKSIINSGALAERKTFNAVLAEVGISDRKFENYPATIDEIIIELNEFLDFLVDESSSEILEQATVGFKRDLISHLNALTVKASELFINRNLDEGQVIIPMLHQARMIGKLVTDHNLNLKNEDINNYQKKRAELIQLHRDITKIKNRYNDVSSDFEKSVLLIKSIQDKYQEQVAIGTEIDKIRQSTEQLRTSIENDQRSILKLQEEVGAYFNNTFIPLRNQIEDQNSGIGAILNKSLTTSQYIDGLKGQAQANLDSITTKVVEYESKIKELNDAYSSISEILKNASDPNEGIEPKIKYINDSRIRIEEIVGRVELYHDSTNELKKAIETYHSLSKTNSETIAGNTVEASFALERIQKFYNEVIRVGTGSEFAIARNEYAEEKRKLTNRIETVSILLTLLAMVITALILIGANQDIAKIDSFLALLKSVKLNHNLQWGDILLKYAMLSPLLFLLIFYTNQYKTARLSHEKYMYKTVLNNSIAPIGQDLRNKFNSTEEQKEIFDFVIKTLYKLYDEPYFDQAMAMKFKVESDRIKYGDDDNLVNDSNDPKSKEQIS